MVWGQGKNPKVHQIPPSPSNGTGSDTNHHYHHQLETKYEKEMTNNNNNNNNNKRKPLSSPVDGGYAAALGGNNSSKIHHHSSTSPPVVSPWKKLPPPQTQSISSLPKNNNVQTIHQNAVVTRTSNNIWNPSNRGNHDPCSNNNTHSTVPRSSTVSMNKQNPTHGWSTVVKSNHSSSSLSTKRPIQKNNSTNQSTQNQNHNTNKHTNKSTNKPKGNPYKNNTSAAFKKSHNNKSMNSLPSNNKKKGKQQSPSLSKEEDFPALSISSSSKPEKQTTTHITSHTNSKKPTIQANSTKPGTSIKPLNSKKSILPTHAADNTSLKMNTKSIGKHPSTPTTHIFETPINPQKVTFAAKASSKPMNTKQPSSNILKKNPSILDPKKKIDPHPAIDNTNFILPGINSNNKNTTSAGRQRVTPRKKRFTTLKKRVLQERLEQYRKATDTNDPTQSSSTKTNHTDLFEKDNTQYSTSVCVKNFVQSDDNLQDEDEYEEFVSDLTDLAEKIGPIHSVFIPSDGNIDNNVFVKFQNSQDAHAAQSIWKGMLLSGNKLNVYLVPSTYDNDDDIEWRQNMLSFHLPLKEEGTSKEDTGNANDDKTETIATTKITLDNILTEDDMEDEECLQESIQDVITLAQQYGTVIKDQVKVDMDTKRVTVVYSGEAPNAVASFNGMTIGGSTIVAQIGVETEIKDKPLSTIRIGNILTEDDFEDEECFEESKRDVHLLAEEYGSVKCIEISETNREVYITYDDSEIASLAAESLNMKIIGGIEITAHVHNPSFDNSTVVSSKSKTNVMILENILLEDDFEDEDCLDETKKDIMALVSKYGQVESIIIESNNVIVTFDDESSASNAIQNMNQMIIGGQEISAHLPNMSHNENNNGIDQERNNLVNQSNQVNDKKVDSKKNNTNHKNDSDEPPMYSGDKIIPEKYAACKRVPKIPNKGIPRDYASRIDNDQVVPLLFEMLGELMRLQIRNKEDKNARARRRLVLGFREVARGIRAHKIKMVIMANNLDEYGAIDSKVQDILDRAKEEDVPVLFDLNKRKLGKALGKSIKVGIVGIQNADGAHEPFKKLKKLAGVF